MANLLIPSRGAALALTLLATQAAQGASIMSDVETGQALVEKNCAVCHSIDVKGSSPHPDAPPFRTLSDRYPIDDLAEALAEGISTGHPDMREFVATPEQIDAIIAYIKTLQP